MVVQSGRIALKLHTLSERPGPKLLLLHSLFGSSSDWGELPAAWPGEVYGLDFAGHGQSAWAKGGAYYPELFVIDADAALSHLGSACVAGTGLGAYVALLLAGARPDIVPAALLLPGAGLSGGGALPDWSNPDGDWRRTHPGEPQGGFDPMLRTVRRDVRPTDYAESFAATASCVLLVEDGSERPPWWEATRQSAQTRIVCTDVCAAMGVMSEAVAVTPQSRRGEK